jgi:hypothetical protein
MNQKIKMIIDHKILLHKKRKKRKDCTKKERNKKFNKNKVRLI